eukprot:1177656-Prorocentrum_minimum.AAC.1
MATSPQGGRSPASTRFRSSIEPQNRTALRRPSKVQTLSTLSRVSLPFRFRRFSGRRSRRVAPCPPQALGSGVRLPGRPPAGEPRGGPALSDRSDAQTALEGRAPTA